MVKKTLLIDGDPNGELTIGNDYDALGRETRATFPGNTAVTRDYYDDGLPRRSKVYGCSFRHQTAILRYGQVMN